MRADDDFPVLTDAVASMPRARERATDVPRADRSSRKPTIDATPAERRPSPANGVDWRSADRRQRRRSPPCAVDSRRRAGPPPLGRVADEHGEPSVDLGCARKSTTTSIARRTAPDSLSPLPIDARAAATRAALADERRRIRGCGTRRRARAASTPMARRRPSRKRADRRRCRRSAAPARRHRRSSTPQRRSAAIASRRVDATTRAGTLHGRGDSHAGAAADRPVHRHRTARRSWREQLQPIVDRASAELVATINEHVGELLRTYVAEAIEREIEQWRATSRVDRAVARVGSPC